MLRLPVFALRLILVIGAAIALNARAADPIRVACVGDSITYGYGLNDRAHHSYPALLQAWLGPNYNVQNFGVNAKTLLKQADQPYIKTGAYTNALNFKADLLVINLGANDSKHPVPGDPDNTTVTAVNNWQYASNYVADYEELIAAFRKSSPAVKIYVCLPTPDYPGHWGISDKTIREEMIPMIRQVAKDQNANIIDLYTALAGKPELFPDKVHPNDEGVRLMASEVYRILVGHAPPTP
jgi:lysophospholipase L1-like esterase